MGMLMKQVGRDLSAGEWQEVRSDLDRFHETVHETPSDERSLARKAYDAIQVRPSVMGVSVDLKPLIEAGVRRVKLGRRR